MLEHLSLHTKVRRLGYLKILVKQYFSKDFLPITSFNHYYERLASIPEVQKQLEYYALYYRKDKHGVIENLGTGASAQYYTKLAEDLSIIAKSNYSYILTKYSKVYKVIYERYETEKNKFRFINEKKLQEPLSLFARAEETSNPFVLNTLDKLFFLRQIIDKDLLYIKSILKIINSYGVILSRDKVKYEVLKNDLINELIAAVSNIQTSTYVNAKDRKRANDLENKLLKKDLKIRSYESIVEPRLNWLLDLDLLDGVKFSQDIIKLNRAGEILLKLLCDEFDSTKLMETELIKICSLIYDINFKIDKYPEKRMSKYLDYAFINFKTLAPNRITASQAFSYVSIMCFLRDGLRLEFQDVKNYVFSIEGEGYTIDWYPSENDGSIKKIKK